MAHFLAGCRGSSGNSITRLAGQHSSPEAWVQGWGSGVTVRAGSDEQGDYFDIYSTGGSNGAVVGELIGTLRRVKDTLRFTKSKKATG